MTTDSDGRATTPALKPTAAAWRWTTATASAPPRISDQPVPTCYNDKPDWALPGSTAALPIAHQQVLVWADTDFQNDKVDVVTLAHTHRWVGWQQPEDQPA
jgi:hypothetical protein